MDTSVIDRIQSSLYRWASRQGIDDEWADTGLDDALLWYDRRSISNGDEIILSKIGRVRDEYRLILSVAKKCARRAWLRYMRLDKRSPRPNEAPEGWKEVPLSVLTSIHKEVGWSIERIDDDTGMLADVMALVPQSIADAMMESARKPGQLNIRDLISDMVESTGMSRGYITKRLSMFRKAVKEQYGLHEDSDWHEVKRAITDRMVEKEATR